MCLSTLTRNSSAPWRYFAKLVEPTSQVILLKTVTGNLDLCFIHRTRSSKTSFFEKCRAWPSVCPFFCCLWHFLKLNCASRIASLNRNPDFSSTLQSVSSDVTWSRRSNMESSRKQGENRVCVRTVWVSQIGHMRRNCHDRSLK